MSVSAIQTVQKPCNMLLQISAAKECKRKREPNHSEKAPVNMRQEESLGYVCQF